MTMSYINFQDLNAPSSTTAKPAVLSRLINFPRTLVNTTIELRRLQTSKTVRSPAWL